MERALIFILPHRRGEADGSTLRARRHKLRSAIADISLQRSRIRNARLGWDASSPGKKCCTASATTSASVLSDKPKPPLVMFEVRESNSPSTRCGADRLLGFPPPDWR